MASVHDVAAFILEKVGPITAMKLQKLAYYSQSWHLVWEGKPLFSETIEAWANGPVSPDLYNEHRGLFLVAELQRGLGSALSADEKSTVEAVIGHYASKTPLELSELTHREEPWRAARVGLAPGQRGNNRISEASMAEYYEGLVATSS